jgi:hypothetical protein
MQAKPLILGEHNADNHICAVRIKVGAAQGPELPHNIALSCACKARKIPTLLLCKQE